MSDYLRPRKPKLSEDEIKFNLSRSEKKMATGMKGLNRITSGNFSDRIPTPTGGVVILPVDELVVSEQVRKNINPEGLRELAENIRKHGLINPITVRKLPDGKYEVIAGHRRLLAVRDVLGRDVVECRVLDVRSDAEKTVVQISENVQREDLHPVELADAVGKVAMELLGTRVPKEKSQEQQEDTKNRLCRLSLNLLKYPDRLSDEEKAFVAKVMERCGVSRYQLAISLYLYMLPEEIKKELTGLDVSLRHFRVMLEKQLEPEEVLNFARMAHEKGLSASALSVAIGTKKRKPVPRGVERIYTQVRTFEQRMLKSKYVREIPEVRQRLKEELMRLVKMLEDMD